MRPQLSALVLCGAFGVSLIAQADPYIVVDRAQFKPLPVAITESQGDKALAAEFTATVREDLVLCGFFELLKPQSFLVDPAVEPNALAQIDFTKWKSVGAQDLAKAVVTRNGGNATVEAWLFDVLGTAELLHSSYPGTTDDIRTLGHRWANDIVKRLTGQDSFFLARIAYVRPTGHNEKELWISDFDGRHATNLTPGGGLNLLPAWSPDGRTIAFTSFRDGTPMLYSVDVATKKVTLLHKRGTLQTGAAWSPDSKRIAFTMTEKGGANIYVMNADGSDLKALTDTRETNSSPAWSPDGKRLAFVSTRSGDPQIFVMNADGSGVQRLTFQGRYNQTPDWSPRGDEVAFTARDERNAFDLFAVNVETQGIRRLTQDTPNNDEPSWSANGNSLLFNTTRTGKKTIWIMNRDGTNQRPLHFQLEAMTPVWGPPK
jgi:TolB protein